MAFVLIVVSPTLQAGDPVGLIAAVRSYLESRHDLDTPNFRYALTDLDGDGRNDAVVLMQNSKSCGSGGCQMLVLRGTKEGFTFVSGSTITKAPIRVSPIRANGWKTLIVSSGGTGDVLMRFDGKRYPGNPSMQPKAERAQVSASQVVVE